MKTLLVSLSSVLLILLSNASHGETNNCQVKGDNNGFVKLSGGIVGAKDISAIAKIGKNDSFLVIGSDEACTVGEVCVNEACTVREEKRENCPSSEVKLGNYIQVLKKITKDNYQVHENIFLFKGDEKDGEEMDIEGLTVEGRKLYVIGSHSSKRVKIKKKRKKPKDVVSYEGNRQKFYGEEIKDPTNQDWLYQFTIDSQGKVVDKSMQKASLNEIIEEDDVLELFSKIPSKENGVDIEGIASKGEELYLGFRGPVFRKNYVPIMKLGFDDPEDTNELLYVKLGGLGIRDITGVDKGFLIVAGPVGDGPGSYRLYHWDGKDVIPGKGKGRKPEDVGKTEYLCEIIPPKKGKAEGVVVISEDEGFYNLIIAYDGVKDKNKILQHFEIPKHKKE